MLDSKGLQDFRNSPTAQLGKDAPRKDDGFDYLWIRASQLTDGTHPFRVAPSHPEKCASGIRFYAQHWIEKEPAGTLDNGGLVKILCPSCYPDKQSCILCECAAIVRDDDLLKVLPDSVKKAVNGLFPQISYLLPTVWRVREDKVKKKNGREGSVYSYDTKADEKMAVFQITAESILDGLEKINQMKPTFSLADHRGCYILFKKKKHKYDLIPEPEDRAIDSDYRELMKSYPDIDGFGKNNHSDEAGLTALLKSCWWWKYLGEHIEL